MAQWPNIPGLIFTDSVQWRPVKMWTKDAALGRVPTFGPLSSPINCTVQPDEAQMIDEHGRQALVVRHSVIMSDNPGVQIRDQFIWAEGNKTLTVISAIPTGDGRGRIWDFDCEERPTA